MVTKTLSKNPITMNNKRWEWVFSVLVYAGVFLFMWEYHRWRGRPYSLFTANKALAIASCLLLSFSLALGPLYRLTGRFRQAIRIRRSLGVTAAVFIVLHVLVSLFLVGEFDLAYYMKYWLSSVFGATALIGFLMLWATSYKWALRKLGRGRWKALHATGYLFLAFVVLHILAHGKFPNWILWFRTFNQPVPPGTMVPSFFASVTILLKVIDRVVYAKMGLSC
ncbi:MAG: ferric reductase-like transmembrane domain-containing protein [Planctomycetota bacterium]